MNCIGRKKQNYSIIIELDANQSLLNRINSKKSKTSAIIYSQAYNSAKK